MGGSYGADALVERSFTYDGLGRLATASGPWERPQGETGSVTWTYSYDVLGNLRSQTSSSSAPYERTWTYADPDRPRFLTQFEELVDPNTVVTDSMVADAAGNPASINSENLVWNGQGRMASKGDPYTNGINYFDGSGKRVMRWWYATQILYIGDDFEYDTGLGMSTKYFFLNGERVASRSYYYEAQSAWIPPGVYRFAIEPLRPLVVPALLVLGALGLLSLLAVGLGAPLPPAAAAPAVALLAAALVLYPTSAARAIIGGGGDPEWHGGHSKPLVIYGNDPLGSTRVVIDAEGDTIETRDYAPFGKTVAHSGAYDVKHRFTSQPYDDGVELYNYGARMYEPRWGRFVSADEMVEGLESQGMTRYAYVGSSPASASDPTGRYRVFTGWGSPGLTSWSPSLQNDLGRSIYSHPGFFKNPASQKGNADESAAAEIDAELEARVEAGELPAGVLAGDEEEESAESDTDFTVGAKFEITIAFPGMGGFSITVAAVQGHDSQERAFRSALYLQHSWADGFKFDMDFGYVFAFAGIGEFPTLSTFDLSWRGHGLNVFFRGDAPVGFGYTRGFGFGVSTSTPGPVYYDERRRYRGVKRGWRREAN